ncbi:MAG: hypothetical protein ACRYFX_18980 [Janthinobacterium lividum]
MPFLLAAISADKIYTALAGIFVAVLGLLAEMGRSAFVQWRENRKKVKQSSLGYLAEKQVLLDQATERICIEAKADHVGLYRLHNGEFFEGNDSIKKMSMDSEAIGNHGVTRWKFESQALLISNFPHLVLALAGPAKLPFYLLTPDSCLDFEVGRLLNKRKISCAVALLIRGRKDKPLAFLFLSWHQQAMTLEELNVAQLEAHRRDLSYILSE